MLFIQYFCWEKGGLKTKLLCVQTAPNEIAQTNAPYFTRSIPCIAANFFLCNTNKRIVQMHIYIYINFVFLYIFSQCICLYYIHKISNVHYVCGTSENNGHVS